jgi:hypothetical protein
MARSGAAIKLNLENGDEVVTVKVYKTKDYEKFTFARENRPIYPRHVAKMERSLKEHGFLIDSPIRVVEANGKLVITDGQHRFEAARNLGLDLFYVFSRDENPFTDIQVMHTYIRGWRMDDYVHHFVARNAPAYKALDDLCRTYRLPPSGAVQIMSLAFGAIEGNNLTRDAIKDGTLAIGPEQAELAKVLFQRMNGIRFLHERFSPLVQDIRFIKALGYMILHRDYDHERMLVALKKQITALVSCGTMDDYLVVLSEIYNHGRRIRLEFKRGRPEPLVSE